MRRVLLSLAAPLAALAVAAPAEAGTKLLCNTVVQRPGEAAITYAVPREEPARCTVQPWGVAEDRAVAFTDATWEDWGADRATAEATVDGELERLVLSRMRSQCGKLVYTRLTIAGVRRTVRPDTCVLSRRERFCGYRDFTDGTWTRRDVADGAFLRLFARGGLGCRAARRAYGDLSYESGEPALPGWTCTDLVQAYEYGDTRCRRTGTTRAFRVQSGA